jgi:hypothetical protein
MDYCIMTRAAASPSQEALQDSADPARGTRLMRRNALQMHVAARPGPVDVPAFPVARA